jgi:cyclopropane-fatty-acyl-phospholipid synthase
MVERSKGTAQAVEKAGRAVPRTFWQKLVLGGLSSIQAGRLTLIMVDGERLVFESKLKLKTKLKTELKTDFGTEHVEAKIILKDDNFFKRCVLFGHIGFAESFMDGEWESDDVASVIALFLLNVGACPMMEGSKNHSAAFNLFGFINQMQHLLRQNSERNSKKNIADHYDLSNELFKLFLDETMTYSCAYFARPDMTLKEAQIEKYERLCRKLRLKKDDHVLEIGCGWGGFAIYAATNYGCRVTGVTISQEQYDFAAARISSLGLNNQIKLVLEDYRKLEGLYDKVVSIEMIEAVGHEYIPAFFARINKLLKPDGLAALQMITCPESRYDLLRHNTDFIQKHIFPGSLLVSMRRISNALADKIDGCELFLHECEDMGNYYAQTLELWRQNFEQGLSNVTALGFDPVFIRKWRYYFGYCAAAFAMRNISVVQVVYTRPNNLNLSDPAWLARFSANK